MRVPELLETPPVVWIPTTTRPFSTVSCQMGLPLWPPNVSMS
jgi:hypothetical protein